MNWLAFTDLGRDAKLKAITTGQFDVNTQSPFSGMTMLHSACHGSQLDLEMAQCLVAHKANLETKDFREETALMWAAAGGSVDGILFLIHARANVSTFTSAGRTVLSCMIFRLSLTTYEIGQVLRAGAYDCMNVDHGQTKECIASIWNRGDLQFSREQCVTLLTEWGKHVRKCLANVVSVGVLIPIIMNYFNPTMHCPCSASFLHS